VSDSGTKLPAAQPSGQGTGSGTNLLKEHHKMNIHSRGGSGTWLKCLLTVTLSIGWLSACKTTHQIDVTQKNFSGFLGDYSMLQKGSGDEANFLYIDKSVKFAKYTKVYIKPVQLWKSDSDNGLSKLSHDDQQMLVSYFNTSLADSLKANFQIVSQAGPDVLVVSAAITDGRGSKPVLNVISSILPIGLVISYAKRAITGTGTAVGVIYVEGNFTDGATGQRVAAVVDARAGTKALRTKFDGTWGDAKLAFDWWSQRLDARLELLKKGDYSIETL
jgi:Protein of unknown function (DUF3313)